MIELNIVSNSNDVLIKSKNAFALNKSKKKDTQNHGYGQKIISDIAKKYNGTYTTKAENEYFSTVTQLNIIWIWNYIKFNILVILFEK